MAGTFETTDKILPGAYINVRTNEPLSLIPGERGTVALLQEMTVGEDGAVYEITAEAAAWPEGAAAADMLLAGEALKKAKTVLVYKLPAEHDEAALTAALAALKTISFQVLCYPYDGGSTDANKTAIAAWVKEMRSAEGVKCQAVLANHEADSEAVINVVQGIKLSDGTELTAAQTTAWVAGAAAGAGITASNTGAAYAGAVDVIPRMTKTEMEAAVTAGKFIFKVDTAQNVTVVYDINSLTTVTEEAGKVFKKNRLIRTIDNIANDVAKIFEADYVGKVNNDDNGRMLLKAYLADYFTALQNMGAIKNFETDDITISAGADADAVEITCSIQPLDSVEKIYITVNLS